MSAGGRTHIFLSDVHFGAFPEKKETEIAGSLLSLIRHCTEQNIVIHILGDLFDYWMEYPDKNFVPPFGSEILDAFEVYNKSAGPASYITGNHDNWTCGYFAEKGFEVEPDYKLIKTKAHRILLIHGDGLYRPGKSMKRPFLHRVIRSKSFVRLYRFLLPPKAGLGLMKFISSRARRLGSTDVSRLNSHAGQVLNTPDIDVIIAGHDHIARKKTFPGGLYLNCGAFFEQNSLILYNKSSFLTVRWQASAKEFVPFSQTIQTE